MVESREDAGTAGPVTAYIVSGVNSSGNRLLASILVRSGCAGEGSTRQPRGNSESSPAGSCVPTDMIAKSMARVSDPKIERENIEGSNKCIIKLKTMVRENKNELNAR